jgi:hypothetical protein
MELLVYARNHGLSTGRSFVGIAVGECPHMETLPMDAPTSFVEVRIPAGVSDPATEIGLLVAKALAAQGAPGSQRELRYEGRRGAVRLQAEPGFDTQRAICRLLLPVLQRCRVHRGTLTTLPAAAPLRVRPVRAPSTPLRAIGDTVESDTAVGA